MVARNLILSVLALQQGLLCAGEIIEYPTQTFLDVPTRVTCSTGTGNIEYSQDDVIKTLQAAWSHREKPIGPPDKAAYPHQYYGDPTYFGGCVKPLLEFPLFRTHPYQGGDPSHVRVIYNELGGPDNNIRYCGTLIHKKKGNDFNRCIDAQKANFEVWGDL
ncbi:hypothetical protein BJY04DRAFT_221604 [Aspergillus karnatakaensis]|uniref:uncharacterized protein n=1 Tax=Aspergillus karnatakaensis TaxID=1810916 RepID=UPI003CCCED29